LAQFPNDSTVADIPGYIISVDTKTLGSLDRPVTTTRVLIKCPECGKERWTNWGNVKRLGNYLCKSCNTGIRWKDPKYRENHREMMRDRWQDPEFRKKWADAQSGVLSGLHRRVKVEIIRQGISGFLSEQLIGKHRVDEVNNERKVALEIFGDYWHCNPSLYLSDDVISRDGQKVTAKDIWQKDQERLSDILSAGYSVYIIWEREFENLPEETIKRFREWLEIEVGLSTTQEAIKIANLFWTNH